MSRDSTRAPHIGGVEHEPTARYPVITAQLRVRFRIPRSWAECQIPGLVEAERLFCIQAALPMVWFSAKCVAS
ncbi:hypothetical protein AB0I45_12960, partial [Brevibacterium sp. NPDC049920]|uniref:hypothetical protein n=1 Tax=Brevibacterium sp. NPDC049920 TaxID=3155279 RepID=UPI003405B43D